MSLAQVHLDALVAQSTGSEGVTLAVIDGPVDTGHEGFGGKSFRTVEGDPRVQCSVDNSLACKHGTFVASELGAARGSGAPALAPSCPMILRPIFAEGVDASGRAPTVTAADLALAIRDVLRAGARVVNLSVGLADTAMEPSPALDEAFDEARRRGVVVIAAAGNQGALGAVPLFAHPWVIPVVACDAGGRPLADATYGPSVGRYGLMAPGSGIQGLSSGGGLREMTGSSAAAPFVSGAAALLWSLRPGVSAVQLITALRGDSRARRGVVPPLLDAEQALRALGGG